MTPDSPANSGVPQVIGRYQILKRVGAGGMGTVYKARHLDLGREVALKVLPPEMAIKGEMLERFRQEAKNAAKLRHEHIVTLYEFGESKGIHFLAMEFVNGKNLHEYIDQKVRLDPEVARKLMIQAARALDLAHQEAIVHRDIKPSNFLLSEKDGKLFVKLTDFGLARSMDDSEFKVTRSGTTVGTVDYISPEQARNSRSADIRSDIYSLGCTFYHMLTGQAPFPDGDMTERLLKHVEATPDDVRKFNPKVPAGMVVVLNRMLAKRPESRYQTPTELLKELEHLPSGPVLSPRELLEALAMESTKKPKSKDEKKNSPSESTRLLGQPLEPGEIPRLRYRHEKMRARRKSLENNGRGSYLPFVIQGWKAWASISVGTLVVLGTVIIFALNWNTWIAERENAQGTASSPEGAREEFESPQKNAQSGSQDRSDASPNSMRIAQKDAKDSQTPIDRTTPIPTVRIDKAKSFSKAVYSPPPEQLALLQKQFQTITGKPAEPQGKEPALPPNVPIDINPAQPSSFSKKAATKVGAPGTTTGKEGSLPAVGVSGSGSPVLHVSRYPFGSEGGHFDSLKSACAAAPADRETAIEIDDNGPLFEGPIAVGGRKLVIRAGKGYRPLLVWDIQAPASSRTSRFFAASRTNLGLENIDVAVKVSDSGIDERLSLFVMEGGEFSAEHCSFSIAGRHRAGTSVVTLDPAKEGSCPKARMRACYVRSADAMAFDIRAAGAEVTVDQCLLVCANRPVMEIAGKAGAATSMVRAAHSTLVSAQSLFRVRPASRSDAQPAVHWLLWDSLLGRCGTQGTGDLLELQEGVGRTGMRWQAINCLYAGWATLLKGDSETVTQSQVEIWRKVWNNGDGDRVALETWPAVVRPDPSEMEAMSFRVVGTHASFSDSTGANTLGCDVSLLPAVHDNWLSITFERTAPPLVDLPASDQPPAIPDPGDKLYHGEQLDLTNINLGDYLRGMEQNKKFGPRIVLQLRGKGEGLAHQTIRVKGSSLILFFEPADKDEERLVLMPKSAADREALIEVEGGSCEILGGKIRFPNSRNVPVPQYLVKVQGGHLYIVGSHLEGPTGQVPNSYRGLIQFSGSGDGSPDQAQECALSDSILLSGLGCIHALNAGSRVRAQNCVVVAGSEAFYLEPGVAGARLNGQCIFERNSIAALGAVLRVGDAANLPAVIDPIVVQAHGNVFVNLSPGAQKKGGLLQAEEKALSHGLLVWQGENNTYDKQLNFFASPREQAPASLAQPYDKWTQLWGSSGDRRPLFVDMPARTLDLNNLQLDRLALPDSFRSRIRGQQPGADLEQLGIVKKSKKK